MAHYTAFTSRIVPLPIDNVDTDQIIPARYLKTTNKEGLGDSLFADWRYEADGTPKPDFVLQRPDYQGAQILLAGDNFGCGSSREHAPWALAAWGFRAVISTSFADIFYNNSLKNGLLPIVVDRAAHADLLDLTQESAAAELTVDLESQAITLPGGRQITFPIDAFARKCLLQGVDQLGYLQSFEQQISAYEEAHGV